MPGTEGRPATQGGRARRANVPDIATFVGFVDGDDLSMVLRSHLALETVLNGVLGRVGPNGNELDRIPFMAKVDVAIALGSLDPSLRAGFQKGNGIRNRFAHDLGVTLAETDATDFIGSFDVSVWDGFMFRSYQAALGEPPHGRVAFAFATLFVYASIQGQLLPDLLDAAARRRVGR